MVGGFVSSSGGGGFLLSFLDRNDAQNEWIHGSTGRESKKNLKGLRFFYTKKISLCYK